MSEIYDLQNGTFSLPVHGHDDEIFKRDAQVANFTWKRIMPLTNRMKYHSRSGNSKIN